MTGRFISGGLMAVTELALTFVIQSTMLLGLGLLAGRVLKRSGPAVQSVVYRTTLLAVLLCPCASMLLAATGSDGLILRMSSLLASGTPAESSASLTSPQDLAIGGPANGLREQNRDVPSASARALRSVNAPRFGEERELGSMSSVPAVATTNRFPAWRSWGILMCVAVWLMGSVLVAARLWVGQWRMARLRSGAIPAGLAAETLCGELARRMGVCPPAVLRSPFLSSPCLDGLRRPVILLPEDHETNLRETLVHELAHLVRNDGLWNLLRRLSTAAFWFQPLLWVLSRRLEVTAEEVCDDFVVENGAERARYAGHLLELAERTLPPLAPSAVGMISLRSMLARRVTRILDSSRALSTRAGKRVVAATLLLGLAGTLLAGMIGVGEGNRPALGGEQKGAQPVIASGTSSRAPVRKKSVQGRVVGPEGKPVAGATVTVARYRRASTDPYFSGSGTQWEPERQEMDRARSDAEGRFGLTFEDREIGLAEDRDSPDRWGAPLFVAWAPGFGPDWVEGELTGDHPLQLARDDVPINGRIIDLEGRPVAGAAVRVYRLEGPQNAEVFARWLKAVTAKAAGDDRWFPAYNQLAGAELAVSGQAVTDADGRFRLNGLGTDRLATLEISGPSIALRRFQVVTRLMERVAGAPVAKGRLLDLDYHGAACTIVVEPGRMIEGMVRDAENSEPISGAIVTAMQLFDSKMSIEGMITAMTDAQGRYRLAGLPKGKGHELSVYPALDRPYFITEFLKVPDSAGLGPVHYDITLKRGIWLSGRVTDAKTGMPVQAGIHYYPFLSNKHAVGYPNFRVGRLSFYWTGSRYRTDADGRYRVVGLPGRGIVAVKSFDRTYNLGVGIDGLSVQPGRRSDRSFGLPTYNALNPGEFHAVAEVDPPADGVEATHDFRLEPGKSVTVQLVDPDGKPLAQVTAQGRTAAVPELGDVNLHDQTRFQVVGLSPTATRTVVFEHRGRNLGGALVIKPADQADEALRVVTLRPCASATGRLVDNAGEPVRGGVELHLGYGDNNEGGLVFQPQALDLNGRFRIDGLAPGAPYTLWAKDRVDYSALGEPARIFQAFAMIKELIALPGQVVDVGTFNAVTGERTEVPAKRR
jgi:beta-lactamase regulating signal transducer with metallopeptidase domain